MTKKTFGNQQILSITIVCEGTESGISHARSRLMDPWNNAVETTDP